MKKIQYIQPVTKTRTMEQQPLMAASPDVSDPGTEVNVPGTGGGGNAGGAHSKQWHSVWDEETDE